MRLLLRLLLLGVLRPHLIRRLHCRVLLSTVLLLRLDAKERLVVGHICSGGGRVTASAPVPRRCTHVVILLVLVLVVDLRVLGRVQWLLLLLLLIILLHVVLLQWEGVI